MRLSHRTSDRSRAWHQQTGGFFSVDGEQILDTPTLLRSEIAPSVMSHMQTRVNDTTYARSVSNREGGMQHVSVPNQGVCLIHEGHAFTSDDGLLAVHPNTRDMAHYSFETALVCGFAVADLLRRSQDPQA